ncbi:uncharacterized protein DUF3152 [Streptomyces sp. SLBN-118]|uniref:DUF3152 domain-containing protein n=1 Tax=Streptomyces sp. SLBN-118 TaxID=2768454 RepID=UPI001150AEC4|nr:DUF3152 domain-containing protein [Streptomyces sp. SLBN-118]TQK52052.1 uncharacterized protein DUF3152 [Streptomyces sp. SLBN-118]
MGRHSRKGPAPKGSDSGSTSGIESYPAGGRRRRPASPGAEQHTPSGYGMPPARGGHPEQHEPGGGWGVPQQYRGGPGGQRVQAPAAPPRTVAGGARIPGPRREFVEAFDQPQPGRQQGRGPQDDPYASTTSWADEPDAALGSDEDGAPGKRDAKGGKGRTFTGIAAAAVTTVLAVVVAGQVAADNHSHSSAQSADEERSGAESPASRSDSRKVPPQKAKPAAPASYQQLMATQFPLAAKLKGSGKFEAVPGFDKAPGKGRKIRYRVDVEQGLGLDGALFAKAVQATLNDDRSWAHDGAMTFERISSGDPEFIITLASPGTTADWCAKSDLDTAEGNVSCDSAKTDRVMINAYRWAQGSETYGAQAMLTYRQMLINHEVGHRLGHGHENCSAPGALAPVMQQQTKSLNIDGIKCKPNPWVYPGS